MYLDDCVCVLPDLTWLPLLGVGRKSWYIIIMNFELPKMSKKWSFGFFRPNLPQLGLYHPYFVCKSSFRVISMTKIVILDQSKPISLYLKIKKSKIQKFVNCTFIIHKKGNKTSIQPILKLNSTFFMFNNIFCEMKGKKLSSGEEWGNRPNYVLEV